MKSSEGHYYAGLDHIRALAAFLVFMWHFLQVNQSHLYPMDHAHDYWIFSLASEGHVGVSIFMVLSGYLFARIVGDRTIHLPNFFFNRFLRLAPLLVAVCVIVLLQKLIQFGPDIAWLWVKSFASGVVRPALPNGGWSITVEFHFYLLFPLVLFFWKRSAAAPWVIIAAMIGFRLLLAQLDTGFTPKDAAYWTIIGRLDQFILGMIAARMVVRPLVGVAIAVAGVAALAYFDRRGGISGEFAATQIWVVYHTIEAAFIAPVIAAYDRLRLRETAISKLIARVGEASYSIYLLHVFVIRFIREFIDQHITPLTDIYTSLLAAAPVFAATALVCWVSYDRFERYFLRFRKPYLSQPGA